jgi:hypothetical protein
MEQIENGLIWWQFNTREIKCCGLYLYLMLMQMEKLMMVTFIEKLPCTDDNIYNTVRLKMHTASLSTQFNTENEAICMLNNYQWLWRLAMPNLKIGHLQSLVKRRQFLVEKQTVQRRYNGVPLPAGCGTEKPGIWKRDPALFALGLSSIYPQVVKDPTRSTRLRRAWTASSDKSASILGEKMRELSSIQFQLT